MPPKVRTFLIWFVLLVVLCGVINFPDDSLPEEDWPSFQADLEEGRIAEVVAVDRGLEVLRHDGSRYLARGWPDAATLDQLALQGVTIDSDSDAWLSLTHLVFIVIAIVLVAAALVYLVKKQGAAQTTNVLDMRRSRALTLKPGESKVTFADVAGSDAVKERLVDIIDYLAAPQRWTQAGARLPRGLLLVGPPGTGKTLLARAVAGEAKVPVFVCSASELVEMFVGVGAARVRDLFENARKAAPAVVFIDELDAIGRRRGTGIGAGHDEREQSLNQLLICLDGFQRDTHIVVIAATNRVDVLDRALLRPGRFDLHLQVPPLDEAARLAALRIHTRDKTLAPDVDLAAIASRTLGLTGADLEQLCNEAALGAVRRERKTGGTGVIAVAAADLDAAAAPLTAREHSYNAVDVLLLESAIQLARPAGTCKARVELVEGAVLEGELLWADAHYLKLETPEGPVIVAKTRIRQVRSLAGTAHVAAPSPDRLAHQLPGSA